MLDFGLLPPEINSGLMYSGPGAGPMVAAAAAWGGLAAELGWAASSYGTVVSGLTSGPWLGPTSVAMAAAASPYVTWMTESAMLAERASTQAMAAVAAYEAAFAMTVPPPVIAANRAQLMALIATNFFGQNTPAIMATEAQYMEMWAQDAAAMYGYAAASHTASTLTAFIPPPETTNSAGLAAQGAAVGQAASMASGIHPATVNVTTPALLTAAPTGLAQLSSSSPSTSPPGWLQALLTWWSTAPQGITGALTGQYGVANGFTNFAYFGLGIPTSLLGAANLSIPPKALAAAAPAASAVPLPASGLGGLKGLAGLAGAPTAVSADVGRATMVGALSVPPNWAQAAPAMGSAAPAPLPGTTVSTGLARGPMSAWGGMPLAGTARRGGDGFFVPRYGMRVTAVPEALKIL